MRFLNIFLLTMGLGLGAGYGLAGTVPGGSGSPSDFPDGITVSGGSNDLTGGTTDIVVPTGQTSSCPNGGTICSGTYTPTVSAIGNLDGNPTITNPCLWQRIGKLVSGSCKFEADPTSAGVISLVRLTLPIATDLVSGDLTIIGAFDTTNVGRGVPIGGNEDAGSDIMVFRWEPQGTEAREVHIYFRYLLD